MQNLDFPTSRGLGPLLHVFYTSDFFTISYQSRALRHFIGSQAHDEAFFLIRWFLAGTAHPDIPKARLCVEIPDPRPLQAFWFGNQAEQWL